MRTRAILCGAVLAATGALAVGCGSDENAATTSSGAPDELAQPEPTFTQPLEPAAVGANTYSAAKVGPSQFLLPSRNIGCAVYPGGARCDIAAKDWRPPPRPASCDFDWGNGASVTGRSRGRILCASDTTLGAQKILGYGKSAKRGAFLCTSSEAGVNCTNIRTRHGFFLSRQSYGLF